MKIIGISGKAQSGKSTLASYLSEKYRCKEYSFAEPIKQIGKIFYFEHNQLYGSGQDKLEKNKHWNVSGREFLQKIGTEVFRDFLPTVIPSMQSVWLNLFRIQYEMNPDIDYVISDVRMKDEVEMIRKLGGIIIRTVRTESQDNFKIHSSETELDDLVPDFLLDNNKYTIEESRKVIDEYLGSI